MRQLRVAIAVLILLVAVVLAVRFVPLYLDNTRLQDFVAELAQNAESRTRPDDALRIEVLEKAASLGLPVKADNVHINRANDSVKIDVRYIVRVDLPLYTVDLHFYPGAGSR